MEVVVDQVRYKDLPHEFQDSFIIKDFVRKFINIKNVFPIKLGVERWERVKFTVQIGRVISRC